MNSPVSSFIHNFSGQLLSRLFSFGINMYLLRRIDSDVLGLVNINLMLFYSTTIFLVREPFRKVFLANEIPLSVVITHLWLAPLVCPLIAVLLYLCFWLPFSTVPDASLVPSYAVALSVFAFSAWLESFAEPYVILSLRFGMDAQYAFAQGFLVIMQRVFVLILIIMVPMLPVHAFCCGQVLSSFCYTLLCIYLLVSGIRSVAPSVSGFTVMSLYPSFPKAFSKENRSLLGAFLIHSIFKQVITNGTGYVLAFTNFFSLSDQAVFDAVDKLGSLVARIIFAPLEHSAYLYFSTCLRRAASAKHRIENDMKKGINAMNGLLHIVIVIGTVIFVFAIPYSPLAVKIYGGALLINNAGANILRFYCFYIIVIAINGITECFAMATMNEEELLAHGWYLFLSSPIQLFLSSLLSYVVGAYGLILANIISMLMRIAYSWRHIRRFSCDQISFLKALPNFSTILVLLFCLLVTSISLLIFGGVGGIMHNAAHIAVGCALFIFVINHIYQNDLYVAKFLGDQSLGGYYD
ncbi:Rft family protein [Acanthocheilonema viteae]